MTTVTLDEIEKSVGSRLRALRGIAQWSEKLHPRGPGGKFADKPDAPQAPSTRGRGPTQPPHAAFGNSVLRPGVSTPGRRISDPLTARGLKPEYKNPLLSEKRTGLPATRKKPDLSNKDRKQRSKDIRARATAAAKQKRQERKKESKYTRLERAREVAALKEGRQSSKDVYGRRRTETPEQAAERRSPDARKKRAQEIRIAAKEKRLQSATKYQKSLDLRIAEASGDGTREAPIKTTDADVALRAMERDMHVEMDRNTFTMALDEMARLATEASGPGNPDINLCLAVVPGTNIFCQEHKDIPRAEMPQVKGPNVRPGSAAAAKMEREGGDEVDGTDEFLAWLGTKGIDVDHGPDGKGIDHPASQLKSTQNQLVGKKVAGMMASGNNPDVPWAPNEGAIFVSRDGYVLDGHHRWAATVGMDYTDGSGEEGDVSMPIIIIDVPISELVNLTNEFTDEFGILGNAASADNKAPDATDAPDKPDAKPAPDISERRSALADRIKSQTDPKFRPGPKPPSGMSEGGRKRAGAIRRSQAKAHARAQAQQKEYVTSNVAKIANIIKVKGPFGNPAHGHAAKHAARGKHGNSIKWPALYDHLQAKGHTKQKSAMISNGLWRKKHGKGPKSARGITGIAKYDPLQLRGPDGRWLNTGGNAAYNFIKRMGLGGGFTVHRGRGDQPKIGYSVAINPKASYVTTEKDLTPELVDAWLDLHKEELSLPGTHLGGWMEKDQLYIDIVRVYPEDSFDAAMEKARRMNQIAIWDIGRGVEIPVGGTGRYEDMVKAMKQKPVLIVMPANATGAEIVEMFRAARRKENAKLIEKNGGCLKCKKEALKKKREALKRQKIKDAP